MKNYLLYFCVAIFVAVGLSACTGDETIVGYETEGEKQEAPTYATFDIAIDGSSTKGNLVSDAGEIDAISSIRLLVYHYTTINNGVCEVDTTILRRGQWRRLQYILRLPYPAIPVHLATCFGV